MRVVLVKTATKHPAIGLGYLAAYLERAKIPVIIIDYFIERLSPEGFKARLREIEPDVVGVSTFSFNIQPSFEIAKFTKEIFPNCHVTMGGAHPRVCRNILSPILMSILASWEKGSRLFWSSSKSLKRANLIAIFRA